MAATTLCGCAACDCKFTCARGGLPQCHSVSKACAIGELQQRCCCSEPNSMLQALGDVSNLQHPGSTPPCSKQGTKNDHSPWSAPRERKRRSKPAQEQGQEAHLSSIEEAEYATSPPKRHNGGSGP